MTDRYAVFGNPLSHSKSPLIHMTFARDTGEDIDYGKIEPALDGFAASVATFRAAGGRGINITAPFKLEAHALATRRMPRADSAGAANCLKFEGD
ncbi:MAG TPA: shikimate dehydrogenase, partial [Bradyrhizobium sp.]|nr:shikimate dehydrogenase [Bradyrhizobium sp.]